MLYALTDEKLENIESFVETLLSEGVRVIQLRDKTLSDRELEPTAKRLLEMCREREAKLILDDRVELVKEIDCHGVHIGKDDMRLKEVREFLPEDKIVGVSCYGNVKYAQKMRDDGATYVAFGSFFYSNTKPTSNIVSKSVLIEAKQVLDIPICVIGGITAENISVLSEADMFAVVSDLTRARDLRARLKDYKRVLGGKL
jgi:thiamine-phosphate pyrophosphorylase